MLKKLFNILICVSMIAGLISGGLISCARGQDIKPKEVEQSMRRGIDYLRRQQLPDGSWNVYPVERCGQTALSIIAMLSCGVKANDPAIQRGLKYLRMFSGRESGRNYSISLQTMAFCLAEPQKDIALIKQNIKIIEQSQVKAGTHSGGWTYNLSGGLLSKANDQSDLSNAQFSILALYEAERVGVNIDKKTWTAALRYWRETQNPDGSWGYTPMAGKGSSSPRGSMTCAGIASLVITAGILNKAGADVHGKKIVCFQKPERDVGKQIERGTDWLHDHFSVATNPRAGQYLYYYLYALERVGRMTNLRFIGSHDWYREGTAKILALQDTIDGGWHGLGTPDESSTAFALLFLSKGRRPVLMSKIEFGGDNSWNVHPNDVNNMTLFAEKQWKNEMTWQTVNLDRATADHLLQSPVLYIAGNKRNGLQHREDAAKLRAYLDQGGFLIAEAQPNDESFDKGFRELMSEVFPEPGYELQLLDRNHPVWSAEIPIAPDQVRPIEGIQYGCRTNVVYLPPYEHKPSLSCLWEVAQIYDRGEKYGAEIQNQIDAGLGIGLNILAYATNRELKHKDEIAEHIVKDKEKGTDRRGRIFLPFLDYGGTNPAPHAPLNLLMYLESEFGMTIDRKTERVAPSAEELINFPVLFMHGRQKFRFSDEHRKVLRKHLENGGFLFANAICSSKAFADSFGNEMKMMFPEIMLEKIPLSDPVFTDANGGFTIKTLDLRMTEQMPDKRSVSKTRQAEPELYGMKLPNTDRWIVVFSPYDISCALEKASSMECKGYTQKSALQLASNVILYALEHW